MRGQEQESEKAAACKRGKIIKKIKEADYNQTENDAISYFEWVAGFVYLPGS